MKTRRLLATVIIFSLSVPAFGQGLKTGDFTDNQSSPFGGLGSGLTAPADALACKAPRSKKFFSRSQSSLIDFFKNTSCQTAGAEILGEMLTEVSCSMVNSCVKEKELPLSQDERKRLDSEFMAYMIRENLSAEFVKYQKMESKELRDLLAYVEKMPEDFKKQIKSCPNIKASSEKCLNEESFDDIAKLYFTAFNSNEIRGFDFKPKGKAATLQLENKSGSFGINPAMLTTAYGKPSSFDRWRNVMDQHWDARKSAQLVRSTLDKDTPQTDFLGYVKLERDWAEIIKKHSNNFDPLEDKLVNNVSVAVALDGAILPEEQLKERVKKAIAKFVTEGDDLILSYRKGNTETIDRIIDKMSFKTSDFTSPDRLSLSKKMNELRVQMANEAFASDCDKAVVTLGQMCMKVSENVKAGKINGVSVRRDKLFEEMKASFSKTNPTSEELARRSAFYDRMGMAQDQVYGKYATLIFNVNSCKEKFPGSIEITEKSKEAAREFIQQENKNLQHNKETAAKHIAAIAEKDDSFKRELVKSGFNVDVFAKEKLFTDSYRPAGNEIENKYQVNAPEKIDANVKPMNTLPPVQNTNQNFANTNTNTNSNGVQNNYNFVNTNPEPVVQNNAAVKPLEDKLKALENKEKSLRRKISSNPVTETVDVGESEELAALRKQIEELRQEKAAASSKKDGESKLAVIDKTDPAQTQNSGAERTAGAKLIAETSQEDQSRSEEPAQNRSLVSSQDADFASAAAQASAAAAGGRNPASAGPNAVSGKTGGEKLAGGLVLTKNGELAIDPTAILENPNEGDIALVMEKTKGEPFIIRENGELVKITPVLDAKGKLVLSSEGKIKFKKIKLTKAQQELIAKEVNLNKAAKEVGTEPVRLYKLKSLLKEVRR